ncbi:hypothetical protein ACIBAB_28975 [Streptomyces rubiginosohelvolus]|uniref:hypothetical protein n=1 Tax=Streptomyces rubiginosohelvolus TaxID=67362 RepID=UPI0037992918
MLPQPAAVVVISLGAAPMTVVGADGARAMRSFIASLSPGPTRIRGEGVECVPEVAVAWDTIVARRGRVRVSAPGGRGRLAGGGPAPLTRSCQRRPPA